MIVFATQADARLKYVIRFIGEVIDGKPWELTLDIGFYRQHRGRKINYSAAPVDQHELHIEPHGILSETGISQQVISVDPGDGQCRFFRNSSATGFDLFAAVFFLLSRYEEYLPHTKDEYGRYAYTNSIAFQHKFLNRPLVEEWLLGFRELISTQFPDEPITHPPAFRFVPTYDIDMGWSYKHKGFLRNTGAVVKSLLHADFGGVIERLKVLAGSRRDPFDTYSWLNALHAKYSLRPLYFFLLARRTSRYDKNTNPASAAMKLLLKSHAHIYPVALHPSWSSGDNPALLKDELDTLEAMTGSPVISSRQHYIRFSLPGTYRQLVEAGLRHDYSMGYGSINGFRASVSSAYYWFDLERNEETDLLVHPFCFMDANAFYEQQQGVDETLDEMLRYYRAVEKVNGTFMMIWHNHLVGTDKKFRGWNELYESFLKQVCSGNV